jgi:hypothetical protein
MAIKPPNYQKDAIPTVKGWKHPKTGELLVSTKLNQGQIDEYLGVTPAEPEAVVVDMHTETVIDMDEMIQDMTIEGKLLAAQAADLRSLTKAQLEELGREHGVELDRRLKKEDLIDQLLPYVS